MMNNKFYKLLLFCFMISILFNNLTFASEEVINVGICQNPPLVGIDENNVPYGFFVDLMNYVAEAENLNIQYSFDTLENSFNNLEQGKIDLLLGIAYSDARAEKYIYNNETVYTNWGQVYSKADITINSFLDLEGMNIGVEKGDIHYIGENGIKNILDEFGVSVNYIEYPGRVEMLSDLEEGKIDAGVVSRLFGEYNKSNYDIKPTPILFNPIKLKVIVSNENNQYLLELFDKQMIELKNVPGSIYYQGLNYLLSLDTRLSLPEYAEKIFLMLIAALIILFIMLMIGKRIINKQSKKLLSQNLKLKKLVSNLSELSDIKTMEKLFQTLTNQLRTTLSNDKIELVSLIEFDDGLYLDTEDYVTEKYRKYQQFKIENVPFEYYIKDKFDEFKNSNEQIYFDDYYIIVKFESSHNRQGFLYIETGTPIEDKEFIQIYLSDIITNLQKIIINIKRMNEKTKLFVSLGEFIEKRDHQVANHVKRVSEATKILAEACGFSDEALNNIVIASSVHDIGKIFVPDYILNKPGRLTTEEFEIIKKHATDDLNIIDDVGETLSQVVRDVIRYHHENWDGSGYPEGLIGEDIPYDARIVSIIDVFEALTHVRPYKKAWTYEEALKYILENKGIKFDPSIVDVFEPASRRIYQMFKIFGDDE